MEFQLVLADSEVGRITAADGGLRVELAAAAVLGGGWLQGLVLVLDDATSTHDGAAFGRLAEGQVRVDGHVVTTLSPPATPDGDVELALRFAGGGSLAARGRRLRLLLAADARFNEDLSC